MPAGDPSEWFDPAWMAAIDRPEHQTEVMPVLPIEYLYQLPYLFFQDEPNNQVNPVYLEAWQNQPTTLMPVYPSEQIYGPIHNFPYFFQVISRPVFLPDGTGVTSPPKAEPVTTGRNDLDLAAL